MSTPPPIIPDAMLSYASEYVDTRRPGIIIAMGVLSIVLSVTFALSAVFSLLLTIGVATGPTTVTTATTTSFSAPSPDGIGLLPRQLVLKRVAGFITLSDARKELLDQFLSAHGDEIDARLARLDSPEKADRLITAAQKIDDGSDVIDFSSGRLTLSDAMATFEPTGRTNVIVFNGADNTAAASASAMPTMTTTRTRMKPLSGASVTTMAASGVVAGMLSVLLLVAGIFTVRSRPSGRRLHLWWAWLKLAASLVGSIAVFMLYAEVIGQSSPAGSPGAATSTAIIIALMSLGSAVLYPIAVLIVMNLRSVKNYLSSVN